MSQPFSIQEAIRFGWEKTKQHSVLVFKVVLTLFAVNVAQAIVQKVLEGTTIGGVASFVLGVAGFVLEIGAALITLRLARGEHASYSDLVPSWPLVWKYFVASVLFGLIVLVGLILLIIPGIYFMARFSMALYAILDGAEIMESLSISTKLTEGVKWQILGLIAVSLLLNIVGLILLGVGLLVTMPVTMLAFAHVYTKLKAQHHSHHPVTN